MLKDQQLPRRSNSSSTVATLSKKEQKASRKKKLDKPVEPVAKETADEGVGEAVPSSRSDEKEEEPCGGVKEEVCEDVRVGSGEGCEEGAVGVAEDSRKAEDSVEVINRQQESEGGKVSSLCNLRPCCPKYSLVSYMGIQLLLFFVAKFGSLFAVLLFLAGRCYEAETCTILLPLRWAFACVCF